LFIKLQRARGDVNIPIPKATDAQQNEIAEIVEKILAAKKANPPAESAAWEREIDKLVYGL
jgi:uncharacterized protein YukJ